jgi:hypothetical protein
VNGSLQDVTDARPGACLRGGGDWADGADDDIDDYDAHGARLDGGVLSELRASTASFVTVYFAVSASESCQCVFLNERHAMRVSLHRARVACNGVQRWNQAENGR